jgi:hypothetical protein
VIARVNAYLRAPLSVGSSRYDVALVVGPK